MAIYRVQGPDGNVYKLEAPEGTPDSQLADSLRNYLYDQETQSLRSQAEALRAAPIEAPVPETTVGGQVAEFFKGIPAGAVGLTELAAIGASALAPDEYEQSIRDVIDSTAETLRSPFEASPGYEDTVPRKFGEATGSIAPFLLTAPFGPPGIALAAGIGVAAGAGEARVRAEEGGATAEQKERSTQLGALVGTTEVIPVAKFANTLRKVLPPSVVTTITPAGKRVQETIDEFSTIMGRGKRVFSTAGYEGAQEFAANTAQNLIERGIYNPEQGVFTDSGEALGYGAGVGGLTQAITDMIIGRRVKSSGDRSTPQDTEQSPEDLIRQALGEPAPVDIPPGAPGAIVDTTAPQDQQTLDDDVRALGGLPPRKDVGIPTLTELIPKPPLDAPPADTKTPKDTTLAPVFPEDAQGLPDGVILQNRERSSPVSIQQMNEIANEPDYYKAAFSNSFTDGAPVIFGATPLSKSQLGRKGNLSSGKTKDKIPVQYAVIEATQAIPSNNVDGTSIPNYADLNIPGFRAVTNGRLAGLQEGYRRNTMGQYKQDLMADDIHGIDPAVIGAMQNPLLVRIMPQNLVTKDIADISNTPSGLGFSATETAKNDANRIDLNGLKFRDDGGVSADTVKGFVALMPQTEQQELIDKQGRPTKQAYDRLNAAIFSKAYQNDDILSLAVEAKDEEARNIISALTQAAPQMAALPEGDYDVRPALLEATELAINARRNNQSLLDVIAQQDMISQDPISREIMQLYANNPRSAKKIGEGLKRIADAANTEATKSLEPDMFGDVPARRPLLDVVKEAAVEPQLEGDLFSETTETTEVRISPEQEKAEALSAFKTVLGLAVPTHRTRLASGKTYVIRPKPLTDRQTALLLELAADAIDLGMPASVLKQVTRAGSTGSRSIASLSYPQGWLTIDKQWASQTKEVQRSSLIHEIAHGVDYSGTSSPTLSDTSTWTSAHQELKAWYEKNPIAHPLRYPFAPAFEKKVRIRQESFAQAFAFYFTSPKDLQSNAPDAYSQINDIVQGIQNESRPTQAAGTQARSPIEVDVQQSGRSESGAAIQPRSGASIPSFSREARSPDRAARVTPREAAQEDSQDIPLRDIGTVVVDDNGQPLTVYHGTTAKAITTFDTKRAGAWFSEDPYIAEAYTRRSGKEVGQIISAQLNIKNPLIVPEDIDMSKRYSATEIINRINDDNATTFEPKDFGLNADADVVAFDVVASPKFINTLRRGGFDGIKAFEGGYPTWNIFEGSQATLGSAEGDIPLRDIAPPRTEEFNSWFGDSKIKNSDGTPRLMYHGTTADISEFKLSPKTNRTGNPDGFYFTSDPDEASKFSTDQEGANILPVYLVVKNPFDLQGKNKISDAMVQKFREELRQDNPNLSADWVNSKVEIFEENTAAGRFPFPNISFPTDAMQRVFKAGGYDGLLDGDRHVVAFDPEQIKSAFNLRPTSDPSITRNVDPTYAETGEVRNVADRAALNADIREQKIVEYQSIKQRLSAIQRRRVEERAKDTDDAFERSLFRAAEFLKDDIAASKPTRSTPEDFMARASKALADDDISKDVYDVFDTMFKRNPALLDGIRLSVRQSESGFAGQFLPAARIVRLFKGYGAYNPGTARHEVTHSMEQMMSPEARQQIVNKWAADLNKARKTNKSEQAQKFFDAVIKFTETPSKANYDKTIKALPSYEYYQFVNPSEYWAVNAEKLMQSYLGSGWQRFKMSMKGFLEAVKKTLGLENSHPIYSTFNDLINKPRDRTTINMLTDYIGASAPIMDIQHRNFQGNPAPKPSFESPPDSMAPAWMGGFNTTALRQKTQDKFIDLKKVQKAIGERAGQIEDFKDAYTKESLFYGKTADQELLFLRKEVQPLVAEMQDLKILPQELDAYLLAKHAPERNERIAKINPKFADGGAGITTAQANAYLQTLSPERIKNLESVEKKVRSMIERTQQIEVAGGLETQATIDNWNKTWKNYVPLFREEVDYVNSGSGLGRGFDVRGSSSQRAVGSARDIKSVLNSIFEQRIKAVMRSEKDKVTSAVYALAIENPNTDFWLPINPDAIKDPAAVREELQKLQVNPDDINNIMEAPKVATVVRLKDPNTGEYYETVKYVTSPNSTFSDNVISLRLNGQNRYVIFNPQNEQAKRLVASLKNLDTEQLGYLTQKVGNVTRWIASMSTQYNPIFGIWNFARDLQGSALNLSTTPLAGKQSEVIYDAFKFVPGMYKEYRAARSGEQTTGTLPDLLRRFLRSGAQTGYRQQFTKMEEHGTILDRELQRLNPGNVRKVVGAVGGWLSDYNDVLENAVRLSAFNQAIKMGLSDQKAASIAKELTVNFNRKGSKTPGFSALFAFFNAAVQGTDRMVKTLTGPAGPKIVAGGMLLGVMQALILEAAGFEEDEPTDFIKQKNIVIPIGDGKYVLWPMPLGFNFLPNLGRITAEMIMGGKKKARDQVTEIMEVMADSFNPLGGGGFLQTLSPTVLDPFVAVLGTNTDAFGRPISREDFANAPTPGYLRSRQNATEFSKLFSEVLNSMSGGTEFTKGVVSPTGDDIDYVIGQYLGGVGREAQKLYGLGKSQVTGEEVDTFRIPLFGKIYGTTESSAAIASRFYNAANRMAEHKEEIEGRVGKGQSPQGYIASNPESRLYKATGRIRTQINKINKTIRDLREKDAQNPSIKTLEERREQIMRAYLQMVDAQEPN